MKRGRKEVSRINAYTNSLLEWPKQNLTSDITNHVVCTHTLKKLQLNVSLKKYKFDELCQNFSKCNILVKSKQKVKLINQLNPMP